MINNIYTYNTKIIMRSVLFIKPTCDKTLNLYNSHSTFHEGDSGLDLYIPNDIEICLGETKFINLGIQCEMKEYSKHYPNNEKNVSYYLYPRSSFSKTPLIMGNHVGIIDAGYRGDLIAAVKYIPDKDAISSLLYTNLQIQRPAHGADLLTNSDIQKQVMSNLPKYKIKAGTRLFQICSRTLDPFKYKLSDRLSDSSRGQGGFGSTGI